MKHFNTATGATIAGDQTVSGTVTASDLVAGDDLVVGDDAAVGGDLAVTGTATAADLVATDDLTVGDDAVITGDLTVSGFPNMDLGLGESLAQLILATAGSISGSQTGTGTVGVAGEGTFLSTGATAGGDARIFTGATPGWSPGKTWGVINWSKRIHWQVTLTVSAGTTNGKVRFQVGKAASTVSDLANRGIGVRVDNLALKGLAHNGSSLTVVDLATSVVANTATTIDIVSDGAGNVTWYVNGVSKGTTALGPTGDGTSGDSRAMFEVTNTPDNAAQSAALHRAYYRFAP